MWIVDTPQTKLARNGLSTSEENKTPERKVGKKINVIKAICSRGYRKGTVDLETEQVRSQKVNRVV